MLYTYFITFQLSGIHKLSLKKIIVTSDYFAGKE